MNSKEYFWISRNVIHLFTFPLSIYVETVDDNLTLELIEI